MSVKKKNIPWKWILLFVVVLVFSIIISSSGEVTKEDAIAKIKAQSEVVQYLQEVPRAHVVVDSFDTTLYRIHVFEVINNHTATFNWYTVNKKSGEVKKEF